MDHRFQCFATSENPRCLRELGEAHGKKTDAFAAQARLLSLSREEPCSALYAVGHSQPVPRQTEIDRMRRGLPSNADPGDPGQVIRRDHGHDLVMSGCRNIPLRKLAEPKRQITRSSNGQGIPTKQRSINTARALSRKRSPFSLPRFHQVAVLISLKSWSSHFLAMAVAAPSSGPQKPVKFANSSKAQTEQICETTKHPKAHANMRF